MHFVLDWVHFHSFLDLGNFDREVVMHNVHYSIPISSYSRVVLIHVGYPYVVVVLVYVVVDSAVHQLELHSRIDHLPDSLENYLDGLNSRATSASLTCLHRVLALHLQTSVEQSDLWQCYVAHGSLLCASP